MRFSLGNFPPLASHGVFFLLGMLFNNGVAEPQAESHAFKPARLQIALGKALLDAYAGKQLQTGTMITLVKISEKTRNPLCRFLPEFASLQQCAPFPVVELPAGEILQWKEFLGARDKKNYRLLALSQAAALPLCRETTKVSYGTLF